MVEATTVDDGDEDDDGDDDIEDFLFASMVMDAGDLSLDALKELLVTTIMYITVVTCRAGQSQPQRD